MEWLKVEYYLPDSIGSEPAIKSAERGRARRQRQEQRNESVTVATEESRIDSLMTEAESHSIADITEIKEHSNGIKTWLWLIAAGVIAILLYRYIKTVIKWTKTRQRQKPPKKKKPQR